MSGLRIDGEFDVRTCVIIGPTAADRKERRIWSLSASADIYRAAFKKGNKWWVTDYDEELRVDVIKAGPLDTLKQAKVTLMMLGPTT